MNINYKPILIVEDIIHILELLEVTLHYKGYPVETARNGQEGVHFKLGVSCKLASMQCQTDC